MGVRCEAVIMGLLVTGGRGRGSNPPPCVRTHQLIPMHQFRLISTNSDALQPQTHQLRLMRCASRERQAIGLRPPDSLITPQRINTY